MRVFPSASSCVSVICAFQLPHHAKDLVAEHLSACGHIRILVAFLEPTPLNGVLLSGIEAKASFREGGSGVASVSAFRFRKFRLLTGQRGTGVL